MIVGCALETASGLGKRIEEEESLRNKDFLIIFYRASIFSLCFVCITSTATTIADIKVLAIDYLTVGSMSMIERL